MLWKCYSFKKLKFHLIPIVHINQSEFCPKCPIIRLSIELYRYTQKACISTIDFKKFFEYTTLQSVNLVLFLWWLKHCIKVFECTFIYLRMMDFVENQNAKFSPIIKGDHIRLNDTLFVHFIFRFRSSGVCDLKVI